MRGHCGTRRENRLSKRTGDDLPDLGLAPHERHLPEVASVQVMDLRSNEAERASVPERPRAVEGVSFAARFNSLSNVNFPNSRSTYHRRNC